MKTRIKMNKLSAKVVFPFAAIFIFPFTIHAQNSNVGIGTSTPNPSSILEMQATDKGVLVPRLTSAQRLAIVSPANGLLVFDTDLNCFYFYLSGTATWTSLCSSGGSGGTNGWLITGNAGTVDGTNFLGTTDNIPLNFRVNNQKAGRIESNLATGNTFYGYQVGNVNTATGTANTGVGYNALLSNTTGIQNTAVGFNACRNTTDGISNVAVGWNALRFNTGGDNNTAVGEAALRDNTTGGANTGIGYMSLENNTTGINNSGLGQYTLLANTTGRFNSAVGREALYANVDGDYNVGIGYQALFTMTNGNNITAVGYNANVSNPTGFTNSIVIGSNATVNASNKIRIGNAAITAADIQVAWTVVSDKNEKFDVRSDVPGLNLITKLNPVTYYYKSHLDAHGIDNSIRYTGLLAQDVDAALQELGIVSSIVSKPNQDGSGSWGIRYSELVMPLVNAVQEQQAQIQELKEENQVLKAETVKIKELELRNAQMEAAIQQLQQQMGIKAEK
jgi:hypothetical protein